MPLETAMRRIYDNKIHKLYIVDDENKLLGVVTLNDILAFLRIRLSLKEKD